MKMKGIILAGGSGSRLAPMTNVLSKQILPVYDKPMIYYPLSVLMNFGLRDILIISTPRDVPIIENLLGDGKNLGISLQYAVQPEPKGIAQAYLIAEKFLAGQASCMILGDNIFYGNEDIFEPATALKSGAYIMAYKVSDPERYGVVELENEASTKAVSIEEKPKQPKSNWAVTGLYFYDADVVNIAKNLKPSARGELEITDINREYLKRGQLNVIKAGRGFAWLDAGTPDSLLESAHFVQTIEKRQGIKIACIEEIAYRKGFVNKAQFEKVTSGFKKDSDYYKYLERILSEK